MLVHEQAQQALRRLADELAERGEHRLPTERALAERLGMSRTTVRRALDLLEREHRIRRVKGRAGGAYLTDVTQRDASPQAARPFCQSHGIVRSLNTVKGIPEILHDQGFRDGTTVIRAGLVAAPAPVSSALGMADGEAVVSLLRLRHADGETLSLEQMYLRPELAGVLRTGMTSVYRTLRAQFGLQICAADESIEVASVTSAEGKLLGRPAGTPVLKLERLGFDQRGRAFEYSVDLFRADRTRLHVRTQSPVTAQAM
ncbi:GntR family transcriptional regulator [Mycolicibacterium sp. J2]|uniref:GntR family transcriptional regulator n=1 Tax=Mycolicibacterium sp. J2 TaxID=2993511 RepID=UPI00224A70C4|nr:GntR family transcriptional regulator [Mycolicibacterium sp. J2]MCX2713769.1 GntR family transcriptional regulator [Mycolicibacterium sp. J2]